MTTPAAIILPWTIAATLAALLAVGVGVCLGQGHAITRIRGELASSNRVIEVQAEGLRRSIYAEAQSQRNFAGAMKVNDDLSDRMIAEHKAKKTADNAACGLINQQDPKEIHS